MAGAPHLLVEGGAVHRRVNHTLALLIGLTIGVALGMTYNIIRVERVSRNNCHNVRTLARINHRLVEAQAIQTKALLATGITFGIPKDQIPGLVAQGAAIQRKFLHELDDLAGDC